MGLDAFRRLTSSVGASLLGQGGPPIALDFGVANLKLLQVEPGEPASLIAAACLETPRELLGDHTKRLDHQLQSLGRLVREGGFRGRRAVCAIPGSHTFCKHLQVPKADGVSLSEQVATAISTQLQVDPGALVYRHVEVGPAASAGKTEVIVFATPRELVRKLLEGMRDARLEPVGMHSEFSATLTSFAAANRRQADAALTTMYLDLGAGTTKVMMAHGRDMVFARQVELGGRHMDDMIARQMGVSAADGCKARLAMVEPVPIVSAAASAPASSASGMAVLAASLKKAGVAVAEAPAAAEPARPSLAEALEILTDEIQLSLRYHETLFPGRRLDRLVFVGGVSKAKLFCQAIAKTLRVSAQAADPLARVSRTGKEPALGVDIRDAQPGWSVAVGLCQSPTDL